MPIVPARPDEARFTPGDLLAQDGKALDRIRPGKESPLATQGAGSKDGSLPSYIGWLPRAGDPVWDWDRTWRARLHRAEGKQ